MSCMRQNFSLPRCAWASMAASAAAGLALSWKGRGLFFHTTRTSLPYCVRGCADRVLHARAEGALEVREDHHAWPGRRCGPEHGRVPHWNPLGVGHRRPAAAVCARLGGHCPAGLCRCLGARDVAHHEAKHQRHDDGNRCCSLTHTSLRHAGRSQRWSAPSSPPRRPCLHRVVTDTPEGHRAPEAAACIDLHTPRGETNFPKWSHRLRRSLRARPARCVTAPVGVPVCPRGRSAPPQGSPVRCPDAAIAT
jgi:hypothetical protein